MITSEPRSPYAVLITASGTGSRLGKLTRSASKALVKVGDKPVIAHIIDHYAADIPLVVTLGHGGRELQDFLMVAYPDRNIQFVPVDNYTGPGSSLGYSMLCARENLMRPFIFHACDTLTTATLPAPTTNWVAAHEYSSADHQYRTVRVRDGLVEHIDDKGAGAALIHIGLIGIRDYPAFWQVLQEAYDSTPHNQALNDTDAINGLLARGCQFSVTTVADWHDTGNPAALARTREKFTGQYHVLDKDEEAIYFVNHKVVKFFRDHEVTRQRVQRAHQLAQLIPPNIAHRGGFYSYDFVPGELYATVATPHTFDHLLTWAQENLWTPHEEVSATEFTTVCRDFYEVKTTTRVATVLQQYPEIDRLSHINSDDIPPIADVLSQVDFEALSQAAQYRIHGDFILDNILKTERGFCLLDWRQNFGGLLQSGDIYYDLAKLNHNLTVNHAMVAANHFLIDTTASGVKIDIFRPHRLVLCQEKLRDFVERAGFSWRRIEVLTGIIWLNMSPLHQDPFSKFLFLLGKWQVWRTINQRSSAVLSSTLTESSRQASLSTRVMESSPKYLVHTTATG